MRKLGIVALGAVAALTLAGCAAGGSGASGDDEAAEVRVWLVGADTPDAAREYLKETFEEENPGSTLVIEEQTWDGLVDRLTTSLSSSDSPDVVEFGNTQAPAFTSVGALLDITDEYEALGGDDLLPGFVEAGSYDGKFYAAPLYAGARVVFADPALVDRAAGDARRVRDQGQGARRGEPRQVGHLLRRPGLVQRAPVHLGERRRDRRSRRRRMGRPALVRRVAGRPRAGPGPHAERLARPEGRRQRRAVDPVLRGPGHPVLGSELGARPRERVRDGRPAGAPVGLRPAGQGRRRRPGLRRWLEHRHLGEVGPPDLAKKALEIILSDEFQSIYGENGLIPAKQSLATTLGDSPEAAAFTAAAGNAKLTPASPNWAEVEASRVLEDFFVKVAQGGDLKSLAEEVDTKIEDILNG